MRKLIIITLVFLGSMCQVGCDKEEELIQPSLLTMRWIESYEEKTSEEIEIYRSGDPVDFPFSWYRQVFYFEGNNELEYSVIAANDAHYMARGSWEYNEKTKIIKIYNSEAVKIYEFEIVELTNQVLRLIARE